ncbi:unnamed protein product [Trichogramma brassicae]|uniref:Uncharacterized protein n=1 Tax=Trichogramma brassicae TaxID=86971 RepID=A0A6H5IZ82_9HYME|nr:unnamed protein product [Trichogramma brassicae]
MRLNKIHLVVDASPLQRMKKNIAHARGTRLIRYSVKDDRIMGARFAGPTHTLIAKPAYDGRIIRPVALARGTIRRTLARWLQIGVKPASSRSEPHRPLPIGAQAGVEQQQQQQQRELSRSRWATAQISRVHVTGVYRSIRKGQCHSRT